MKRKSQFPTAPVGKSLNCYDLKRWRTALMLILFPHVHHSYGSYWFKNVDSTNPTKLSVVVVRGWLDIHSIFVLNKSVIKWLSFGLPDCEKKSSEEKKLGLFGTWPPCETMKCFIMLFKRLFILKMLNVPLIDTFLSAKVSFRDLSSFCCSHLLKKSCCEMCFGTYPVLLSPRHPPLYICTNMHRLFDGGEVLLTFLSLHLKYDANNVRSGCFLPFSSAV